MVIMNWMESLAHVLWWKYFVRTDFKKFWSFDRGSVYTAPQLENVPNLTGCNCYIIHLVGVQMELRWLLGRVALQIVTGSKKIQNSMNRRHLRDIVCWLTFFTSATWEKNWQRSLLFFYDIAKWLPNKPWHNFIACIVALSIFLENQNKKGK
jgi:hypothetical protein